MRPLARVVCAPCNARCWASCGRGCGRCCEACMTCGGCCCPENRPSPLFLVYTLLLNGIPGIIFLILAIANIKNDCDTPVPVFLLVTVALNAFFVAFAIHIYRRFCRPYDGTSGPDKSPFSRACHVFLDDPWVSFMVILAIGGFILAIVGFSLFATAECGPPGIKGSKLPKVASIASALLLVYLIGGVIVILISLSLECVRRKPETQQQQPPPHRQGILGRLFFTPGGRQQQQPPAVPANISYPVPIAPPQAMVPPTPYAPPTHNVSPAYVYPPPPQYPQAPVTGVPVGGSPYAPSAPNQGGAYGGAQQYPPQQNYPTPVTGKVEGGAGPSSGAQPAQPTNAEKAAEIGKKLAGGLGTGLKKFGAFVEEKAKTKGPQDKAKGPQDKK